LLGSFFHIGRGAPGKVRGPFFCAAEGLPRRAAPQSLAAAFIPPYYSELGRPRQENRRFSGHMFFFYPQMYSIIKAICRAGLCLRRAARANAPCDF